jgi:multiple sugar transport system substrate-binding protein
MFRILACMMLAVGSLGALAQDAGLWVQVWSYDLPGEEAYLEQLADAFKQETGVPARITFDKWDHAHDTIAQWGADGNGPDLVVVPDIWLVEFARYIEPLDAFVSPDLKNQFYPVLFDKGVYEGDLLGLVWATSTKALFYRKDLFEEAGFDPPATWEEQLGAAVALNNPPHVYGLGLPGKREYETDDNLFFYFWSAGGEFFDANGKCTINSEAGVKSLRFYIDLANKYHVTQPELTTWNRKETRRLFEQGRLAMFATGPWGIEQCRKNAPGLDFGVVPLPVDKEPVTQIITDHLVLMRYSKQKELAKRFIEIAYSDEQRLPYTRLGLIPEKKTVAQDPHFQDDPYWKVFVDVIPYGHTIPLIEWEEIGKAIREAMYQSLSGRQTPQEALDALAEQINQIRATKK